MRMSDKVVLVSGAGGPMGAAVARRMAEEGAHVALTDISGSRLDATVEAIRAIPGRQGDTTGLRASVIVEAEAREVCDSALRHFGRVDVLVNVVGGIASSTLYQPFLDISNERWLGTYELNIAGTRFLTRFLAPGMIARQYGRIINIASTDFGGQVGHADYASSKAAVVSLTRVMAMEFAPYVCVNCIAPGLINTRAVRAIPPEKIQARIDSTLMKRMGEPIEVANAALFLGSEESSFITGEILCVSGGLWASL